MAVRTSARGNELMAAFSADSMRRSKIKLIRQTELSECGLAVLAMIANYHGLEINLGTLRQQFVPSLRGTTLRGLISIADQLGFTSRPVQVPLEALPGLILPAILHWDMTHYVVLERVAGRRLLIHDPAGLSRWVDLGEASQHFTGIALELQPAENFERGDVRRRLRLSQLWGRMTGLGRGLVQTLVLSLIMQAFILLSPYYLQIAVDRALPTEDRNLLVILALGFGLFTLINAAAALLRALVLLSIGTSLSFGVAANLARRLFRLPIAWFEKRHVGDILSRFQSIHPIQQALTEGAIAALLDGALAILTFALMCFYSFSLALIAAACLVIYGLTRYFLYSLERNAQENTIIANSKEQSMMIESVRGITTLRLFNLEGARHAQWLGLLMTATNANVNLSRVRIYQEISNGLIFGLEVIITTWIAILFVMNGAFTLGMVFAYFSYKTQFLTRAVSLVDKLTTFTMLSLHLERISDIALVDEDSSFIPLARPPQELEGHIELRGIRFRYAPSDPLVLQDVNLEVQPNDHIAITGASGGGKTTLVKIILGLMEPSEGEVLIDGLPLARFGVRNYHEQVTAVLQDDSLFAGTLSQNIALFDDAPDLERIIVSASAAAIHDDIQQMPMGYETFVGDMGSSLSGGQKQRILLARALYRRPRLLIMDEGTAHLDPATEAAVNAAISELGITRIIIAHRRETISAADKVYELHGGKLYQAEQPA
jgi:ATP-binding cassette subfamily B protein RaxB